MRKKLLSCLLGGSLIFSTSAQLNKGGKPFSFVNQVPASSIDTAAFTPPNLIQASYTDTENDSKGRPYRVGINLPTQLNTQNSGIWQTLYDGSKIWRLSIKSEDALALGLYYDQIWLPKGSKLFIYNKYKNQILGAYTSHYNQENQIFATEMIQGDVLTLEYYEPAYVIGAPVININTVVYFYRGVEDHVKPWEDEALNQNSGTQRAQSCQVDVACSPENNGWTDQINSVVHYTFSQGGNTYVCSAGMVNNTAQDCTPYILSAWHCGERNAGQNINTWVWYWNYQKATCQPNNNGSNPPKGSQTMTGGTVVASSGNGTLNNPPGNNQVAGSDFYLVLLNSQPPISYNAYYAGWDRTNTATTSGVGIHHPAGSAKKISTFTSSLATITYNGGAPGAHWRVVWAATANGHGVTEGGSSGSPIFNQNRRVVGQLTGGSSFCNTPTSPDLYGKMYTNWNLNGTANTARLSPWLDPINSGANFIDGTYLPCGASAPSCAITASATTVTVGQGVDFFDNSSGNPTAWNWSFPGGTPNSSTQQNPTGITYATPGTYTATLIASNAIGSCTTSVNITVIATQTCDTLNFPPPGTLAIYGAPGGYVTGWNQFGDLAKAEFFNSYGAYSHTTGAFVYLFGVHDSGAGATVNLCAWDNAGPAGAPGAKTILNSFTLSGLDAAAGANSQGLFYLPAAQPFAVNSNPFYMGLEFVGFTANDSLGIVSNSNGDSPAHVSWEQWSNNSWMSITDGWAAGFEISLFVSPTMTNVPVNAVASVTGSACFGSPVNFSASGSQNYTGVDWTFPLGTPTTSTNVNQAVTYASAGTYTAYLEAEGACFSYDIDSIQITINSAIVISPSSNDPSCIGNDGTISISATGGDSNFTYSIDGGTTTQGSGNFTNLGAGTYQLWVSDGSGCTEQQSLTLNSNTGTPAFTVNSFNPSCGVTDGEIIINITSGGQPPYNYSIDNGVNLQTGNTFSNLGAGTYQIYVVDDLGCFSTQTVTLNNTFAPTFFSFESDVSCNGTNDGEITISATGGAPPYEFSINGGAFQSLNQFTGLAGGTYTIIVMDNTGCQVTGSTTINEPTAVSFTHTTQNAECGNLGNITFNAIGGDGSYTYSINNGVNYSANSTQSNLSAGSYELIVQDGSGCTSGMIPVTLTGSPVLTFTHSITPELCGNSNGAIDITVTSGTAQYSYSINNGVNLSSSSSFSGLNAGSYDLYVIDNAGCVATLSVVVPNNGGVNATITNPQTICEGVNATISATGGVSYDWDNGLPSVSTHVVAPTTTTTYTVIITDADGCQASAQTTVTVVPIPITVVTPTSDTICAGETVTLTASGGTAYQWSTTQTTQSIAVSPTSQTTYSVISFNGSCQGNTVSAVIAVNPSPTVVASADQYFVSSVNPVTINFSNSGSLAVSYEWDFGDGNTSTLPNPSHTYAGTGVYTVILTGYLGNCSLTDTITIVVADPNNIDEFSFSDLINIYPNPSEGQFYIELKDNTNEEIKIEVFNGIGQLVYNKVIGNYSNQKALIDIHQHAKGLYLVRLTAGQNSGSKPIILR
ncbi:MAG: PKD domain-containing protein [Flavobacteriales bacterium]